MPYQTQETIEVVPRNYVVAFRRGDAKFWLYPTADITANMLRAPPAVIRARLERRQKRYKDLLAKKNGYSPVFPWSEELLKDENIGETFREAVARREGHYLAFDTRPAGAVKNVVLDGAALKGQVKSKSRRGRSHYNVMIKSPFLSRTDSVDITDVVCGCRNYDEDAGKGRKPVRDFDVHVAALKQEFFSRVKFGVPVRGLEKGDEREPLTLFAFDHNWMPGHLDYEPISSPMAALEIDALVHYYINGAKYDEINRRLLGDVTTYAAPLLNLMNAGRTRFEVVRQDTKKRKISRTESEGQHRLMDELRAVLNSRGYFQPGYCLEFGHPAYRFEDNAGNVVNVIATKDVPIVCSVRPAKQSTPVLFAVDDGEANPFRMLYREETRLDDSTRLWTPVSVQLPTNLRLPQGEMKIDVPDPIIRRYKSTIARNSSDPSGDMAKARISG